MSSTVGSESPEMAQTLSLSTSMSSNPTQAPRHGTVIPNRIFVGGIDFKINESELKKYFSNFGVIKDVKIISDRAGVSKGYGFVTFELQEDAQKLLEADQVVFKDKKLNIGPAIRKQQVGFPQFPFTPASGSVVLTTASGLPYLFHNGTAYFQTPDSMPVQMPFQQPQHLPMSLPQAQPVYHQQPDCYQTRPYQVYGGDRVSFTVPHPQWTAHCAWNSPQNQQSPIMYMQPPPPEFVYPPMAITSGGISSPNVEASVPEPYTDQTIVAPSHQTHMRLPNNMRLTFVGQDHLKDAKTYYMRRPRGAFQGPVKSRIWRNATGFRNRQDLQMEEVILTPPPTPTEGGQ